MQRYEQHLLFVQVEDDIDVSIFAMVSEKL